MRKRKRCKDCYWYRLEDSVWGYCWRFPPKEVMKKWFPKIKYRMEKPEVMEDDIACGEFKERQN